jgi:hypothetical protein
MRGNAEEPFTLGDEPLPIRKRPKLHDNDQKEHLTKPRRPLPCDEEDEQNDNSASFWSSLSSTGKAGIIVACAFVALSLLIAVIVAVTSGDKNRGSNVETARTDNTSLKASDKSEQESGSNRPNKNGTTETESKASAPGVAQDLRAYTDALLRDVPISPNPDFFKANGYKVLEYKMNREVNYIFREILIQVPRVYLTDSITGTSKWYTRVHMIANNPRPGQQYYWLEAVMLP